MFWIVSICPWQTRPSPWCKDWLDFKGIWRTGCFFLELKNMEHWNMNYLRQSLEGSSSSWPELGLNSLTTVCWDKIYTVISVLLWKKIPDKIKLKREQLILAHSWRNKMSAMAGKALWQNCEGLATLGHSQEAETAMLSPHFLLLYSVQDSTQENDVILIFIFRVGHTPSVKPLWKHSHRHAEDMLLRRF